MGDIPASYFSLSEGMNIVLVFEAAFFSGGGASQTLSCHIDLFLFTNLRTDT